MTDNGLIDEKSMLDEPIRIMLAQKDSAAKIKGVMLTVVSDHGSITFTAGDFKGHKRAMQKAISDHGKD